MTTTYRAFCKFHPDYLPELRVAYIDAIADIDAHQAESHALGVLTFPDETPSIERQPEVDDEIDGAADPV